MSDRPTTPTTAVSADDALRWLRSYHSETLALARRLAGQSSEMVRAAHDMHSVPEEHRETQRARYSEAAREFERLRKEIEARI